MGVPVTFLAVCAAAVLAGSLPGAVQAADATLPAGQIKVEQVDVRLTTAGPVVLLMAQRRAIPVFVDAVVAESIRSVLDGRRPVRPLTHDLMHDVLKGFEGEVTKVVITFKGRIYYGALSVRMGEREKIFDSRSSDAIALAIHFKAPILVTQELLDSTSVPLEPDAPLERRL
ncbi:MAG TPA: bifunctional nuclease family protein [Burkholderiales bacterium]|jgi:bifunctional DNase/RNase|nr:bifunctional nuclease family protein [Burkholderiales bacterium]